MRITSSVRALSCLLVVFLFAPHLQATTFTWAGGGTTSWGDALNWDANGIPTSANDSDIVFNTNVNTGTFGVSTLTQNTGSQIFNSLNFGTLAGAFVSGGGTLLIGNGATIRQESSNDQFLSHNFRANATGANSLTLTGNGTGIVTISGPLTDNGLAFQSLAKSGTSTYRLIGTNANLGGYTINAGVLQANNGQGLPSSGGLFFRGGVLQSEGTGSILFSRALNAITFNWGAGGGGFAAGGGGTMTVRIGNNSNTQTWAGTNFVPAGQPLILSSNTATGMVDWQNGIQLGTTGTATRTISVNDNPNLTTDFARMSGSLQGSSGNTLLKNGLGRLELTALNTSVGQTIINQGTVAVMNTGSISGSVRVDNGATFDVSDFTGGGYTFAGARTISGNGTVKGKLNINTTGVISPGSSVGTISTQSQDWGAGGVYNWEIGDGTVTAVAGTGFDQIQIAGGLNVSSSAGGNEFKIKIVSLNGASPGDAPNFDINGTQSWIIATTTGGVTPTFDPAAFSIDRTSFTNDTSASLGTGFFITNVGNDIVLNYDGIPEPGSATLLGLTALTWLTRRPRRRAA